ncbi:MAG: zinc-dependent peptidase [Desulfobacteraceae bacterium]|nr:zinc-dependent peptidase [Desulfobacteraceae bacterium]
MFHWLADHRRKKILEKDFPAEWRLLLQKHVAHYHYLNNEERFYLEQLIQVFAKEKIFEGCNGLEVTDKIRVVISAEACMLLLGLPHDLYRNFHTIFIYPSTVVVPPARQSMFSTAPLIVQSQTAISGQAFKRGPVILVWDAVKKAARHPELGHNVVYHEFAHILDMLDGHANGVPPLHDKKAYASWAAVCSKEFNSLIKKSQMGKRTFLDPYGATNEAEFFAVATEYFFDKPLKMKKNLSALYDILAGFYNQDTAAREKNHRSK